MLGQEFNKAIILLNSHNQPWDAYNPHFTEKENEDQEGQGHIQLILLMAELDFNPRFSDSKAMLLMSH